MTLTPACSTAAPGTFTRDSFDPTVIVLAGYGLAVSVSRGHLVLSDGIGRQRRERRLTRAQRQVKRIVILGQTGYVSLEAVQWCLDTGVALVQIDTLGHVLMHAGGAGRDDARLRRAQAVATYTDTALSIARELIVAKISGQADVLRRHPALAGSAESVAVYIDLAHAAATAADLMGVEAAAAAGYFGAWVGVVGARFAGRETAKVPDHWCHYVSRQSLITNGPSQRNAADPINALLNYGYALAETECVLALRAVGLDPGLGVFHTDQPNRASLALDIIEPVRPVADDLVLQLLARRAFTRDDFTETPTGGCRLSPLLAAELAGHLADLAPVAASYAEHVAQRFAESSPRPIEVTTPLTGSKLRRGHQGTSTSVETPRMARSLSKPTCATCGTPLAKMERIYCAGCFKQARLDQASANLRASNKKLAQLRAQGIDPRSTATVKARRNEGVSAARKAALAWVPTPEEEALTREWFHDLLLPALSAVSIGQIQQALGVSNGSATKFRSGKLTPHKRHWLALAELADIKSGK